MNTKTRVSALIVALIVGNASPVFSQQDPADANKTRDAYLRDQVGKIRDNSLKGIDSKADWDANSKEMRRQLLEMLGLWPLPAKTDLKPVVTGKIEAGGIRVEKIHFQSMPGLYVTANLYLPQKIEGKIPAILYVCGHANVLIKETVGDKTISVSYGSKVHYQYHPVWFAQNGYACIALDTLQLGEIQGIHHGTYNQNMWWWQCMGYTSAGVECWNAMRALDYLQTRPEIDSSRLGVTGRSGGGATSWWIAAADERIKAAVPVAGISDLQAHLLEGIEPRLRKGVITGHCDCMYFINLYRWDFTQLIALCAPRAVLLGNSDEDPIFPKPGYLRMVDKVKKIYALLNAPDGFALLETKGGHVDTAELRRGINAWMNKWLKGDTNPPAAEKPIKFEPKQLKVFDSLPTDEINTQLHEHFIKKAVWETPKSDNHFKESWQKKSGQALADLKQKVFRNWADDQLPLEIKPAETKVFDGVKLQAFDFVSEKEIPLRLFVLSAEKTTKPKLLVAEALNEGEWKKFVAMMGSDFFTILKDGEKVKRNEEEFQQQKRMMAGNDWAFAMIVPRGFGATPWTDTVTIDGKTMDFQLRRRYALLGQTLDSQRVWDVRRGVQVLIANPDFKDVPLWLVGKNEMAGIALYAAIFEPAIQRLDLWNLSPSHRNGPIFLSVLRVLDIPQALALLYPRKVKLYFQNKDESKPFTWVDEFQKVMGKEFLQQRVVGVKQ